MPDHSLLLLGHRGSRSVAGIAENSLAAFDLALQHGCNGFEFDVRCSADGYPVICHDPQIGKLKISESKREQLTDLSDLEQLLKKYHHRAFLDIELKVAGIETKVLAALREHRIESDYVASSFLTDVVWELKARSSSVAVGIICEKPSQLARWPQLPVDFVIAETALIDRKLIEDVHTANRKILAWTVNDKKSMLRLADWQVDGIISDDTRLLCETVKG
ncbi:MAG: hypothetical protein NVS1B11_25460 [Terriglobales bacterium]